MSIEAYEVLYCSSAAFGIRKGRYSDIFLSCSHLNILLALQSQEGKEQLYAKVKDLEVQIDVLFLPFR